MPNTGGVGGRDVAWGLGGGSTAAGTGGSTIASFCFTGRAGRGVALAFAGSGSASAGFGGSGGVTGLGRRNSTSMGRERIARLALIAHDRHRQPCVQDDGDRGCGDVRDGETLAAKAFLQC